MVILDGDRKKKESSRKGDICLLKSIVFTKGFSILGDIKTEKHITRLAKDQTYHKYLPVGATSSTALHKQCKETILVNKEGNS
ncbi:hypothetical protein YC2023_001596 [Brassica napus]